jgi:hypothetical protein
MRGIRRDNFWLFLGWGAVLAGAVFRIVFYLGNDSLFRDEAALVLNVISRPLPGLLEPFEQYQISPLLYSLLLRLISGLGGCLEACFRFPSLISGILALLFFRLLAAASLGNGAGLFLSTCLFAVAYNPVLYSALVKPYATDTLVSVLLLYFSYRLHKTESPRPEAIAALALLCGVSAWISYPSVFVSGAIVLAFFTRTGGTWARVALPVAAALLASFGGLYALGLLESGDAIVYRIWGDAFAPLVPGKWYAGALLEPLDAALGRIRVLQLAAALLCAAGAGFFWKGRDRFLLQVSVLPLLLALFASLLHKYPFQGRMLLFAAPGVFLLLGKGIDGLCGGKPAALRVLLLFFVLPVPYAVISVHSLFGTSGGVREAVMYLEKNSFKDDVILADSFAAAPVRFYAGKEGAGRFSGLRIFYEPAADGGGHETEKPQKVISPLAASSRVWFIAEASGYARQNAGYQRPNTLAIKELLGRERDSCGGYEGERAFALCFSKK